MSVTVRIPMIDFMGDLAAVEEKLTAGGIPPMARRDGVVKRWIDYQQDVAVFEYTPMEDVRLPIRDPMLDLDSP